MTVTFRRETLWLPGYPFTPQFGRGSLKCRQVLHGALGSVEFRWNTGIYPERVTARGRSAISGIGTWRSNAPSGAHVSYHFDAPREYQHDSGAFGEQDCDLRPSGRCHWDASYIDADQVLATFLTDGEDAMWAALEQRYRDWVIDLAQETVA